MSEERALMEYNSERSDLIIPEYGRNIHNMVDYALTIEDKEERNKVVKAIISVMGQLFPYLRDIEDYNHKLWDHLYIMSDFKLDVDSPYPEPKRETFQERPEVMKYPQTKIKNGHYGKSLQELIAKASEYPEGDEKDTLTHIIANLMKRHFVTYNRPNVEDDFIKSQLKELSGGKLELKDGFDLLPTSEIAPPKKPTQSNRGKKGGHSKKKKKR